MRWSSRSYTFLIFINNIMKDDLINVKKASMQMILWCGAQKNTTTQYRLQLTLNELNRWTKQWAVKANDNKTTFSVFSFSSKIPKVQLLIDEIALRQDDSPLTLASPSTKDSLGNSISTDRAETKTKTRRTLMRKLAGSTWSADSQTLKKMYTGYVRPVMEYDM